MFKSWAATAQACARDALREGIAIPFVDALRAYDTSLYKQHQ